MASNVHLRDISYSCVQPFYTLFVILFCSGHGIDPDHYIRGAITFKTWKDDKKRASLKSKSSSQGSTDDATHRVLFHSLAVTLAFLICTMPHSIFYIYVKIHRLQPTHNLNAYHVVNVLISINPFLDPLIYFFFMNHLSKYCFKKRGSKPIRAKVPC